MIHLLSFLANGDIATASFPWGSSPRKTPNLWGLGVFY
nr:MAG TPA: hypothetical protein [Caudoviricetes sp.]